MKQGKQKSRFETIAVILIFFAFSAPSFGHANLKCESLFKPSLTQNIVSRLQTIVPGRFFQPKKNLELNSLQVQMLRELTESAEYKKPYGLGRDENSPLFIFMWQSLKPEMREVVSLILDDTPTEQKRFRNYLDNIYKRYDLNHPSGHSFYDTVISTWADVVKFKTTEYVFSEWIRQIENNFENKIRSGELNRQQLRLQFEQAVRFREAQERWQSYYGVFEIESKQIDHLKKILKLKSGHELESIVSADGKSIEISVPRDLVRRAAWNPIYTEVLQDKIAKGTKPPDVYDGFLATNGIFYLTDGNHRFILDKRERIWIRMSHPAQTASMSISFDAFGFSQPKIEALVEFFDGKKTLDDLIGGANAARIQYK